MSAAQRMDPFDKVALHIGKLVDVPTNKYHSCGYQLQRGYEVGHYKVVHYPLLKEIAKQIDEEHSERSMPLKGPTLGSDTSCIASANLPQAPTPSANRGTSGGGPQQYSATISTNVGPHARTIKKEPSSQAEDDDVVIMFDQPAGPFFVKSHGAGFRVLIRDTKDLSRENVNALLSILVPPENAPAANACPRLNIGALASGGTRIEVADTGLLTTTQVASIRRAIRGTTDVVVDGQQREGVDAPSIPVHQPAPAIVHTAANAPAKRGRPPKDPNAPKRARTARAFFVEDYRVRMADAGLKPTEAIRASWNQLSREERSPFGQRAKEGKERYAAEQAQYTRDVFLQALNPPANGGY